MNKKRIGVTAGAFDLYHAGHAIVFKEAKQVCDYLIVLLHEDPSIAPAAYRGKKKNRPIQSLEERTLILNSVKYIDEIRTYKTEADLYNLLKEINPDIRIIGADWKGKQFTGHDLPIKIHYNSRNHPYSTTELRQRVARSESFSSSPSFPNKE